MHIMYYVISSVETNFVHILHFMKILINILTKFYLML